MAQMQSTPLGWTQNLARWFGGLSGRSEPAVDPVADSGARIVAVRPHLSPAPRSWRGASARTAVLTCCGGAAYDGALPETESRRDRGETATQARHAASGAGNRKAVA